MTVPTPQHDGVRRQDRTSGRIPQPPLTLVSRERLHSALDLGVRTPLTMLVAPAGTGKTVLLSDWVERRRQSGRPVVWISGQAPGALRAQLEPASDTAGQPVPVVVDDAHLLATADIAAIARALTRPQAAVRLVLATRYDLPLPVPELELKGLALTLRARDLRFTDAEATALVRAHARNATPNDIVVCQQKTAGWAAALVLAARRVAAAGDSDELFVSQPPVLDLLLGETVTTLDERVLEMLLGTYEADSVTAEMAAVLSGDLEAGPMLSDLAANGLLVTAYSDGSGGEPLYRYHPLLVELLRRKVATSPEAARTVADAHHRSALYYENHGDARTALHNSLLSDDAEFVAHILLVHGPELLAAGEQSLVAAGLDALPAGYIDAHPQLLGVRGLTRLVAGDVTGAVMDSAAADRLTTAQNRELTPADDALAADTILLRLWESRYGWYDVHAAIDRARKLLAVDGPTAAGRHRPVLGPERLAWSLIELAAAETWADDLEAALTHLDEALVTARRVGHTRLIAAALAHRSVVQYVRGQGLSAAQSAQAALDTVGDAELPQEYSVRAHVVLGFAALNQLDLDSARHWHRLASSADMAGADTVVAALCMMLRAVLLVESGRLDEALTEINTDPAAAGPLPSFLSRDLALLRFRLAVLIGDKHGVDHQVRILEETGNDADAELVRAVLSIQDADARTAVTRIDEALSDREVHPPLACAAASFRTVLLVRAGDESAAEASLLDTLNRVTPQRSLHSLVPVGRETVFLDQVRKNVAGPNPHPFASVVLEGLSGYQYSWSDAGGKTLLGRTRPDLAAPAVRHLDAVVSGVRIRLTAREADVLQQLALGSSYSEIAQALYITENTVKTHLMSLYRKLGVEKRSAALRTARSVGLM
ncbi:LuxR C-terminal-related transcriptional regulator [Kribbella sp. NPDC003557]|uniref:LuxR C-terminal-related transcriptional regulator n=1 Tax=Kribbella sp. NPDC003557 TaxID=3154449 RepID=UPI0033AD355E